MKYIPFRIRPLTTVPRAMLVAMSLLLPLGELAFADPSVAPAAYEGTEGKDIRDDGTTVVTRDKAADNQTPMRPYSGNTIRPAASGLIAEATDLLGIKYRYGGKTPKTGFDCSGFVRHVFIKSVGLTLPGNASQMSLVGQKVSRQQLQPGDLVFYNTRKRAFSHVGIYVGEGKFIHAPTKGSVVKFADMKSRYWRKRFQGARRVAVLDYASETTVQVTDRVTNPGVS